MSIIVLDENFFGQNRRSKCKNLKKIRIISFIIYDLAQPAYLQISQPAFNSYFTA